MRALVLLAVAGCGGAVPAAAPASRGPDIELRQLSERVWLHDSVAVIEPYGAVHANGLLVLGERGAVIVDTSWTPAQTRWLLEQAEAIAGRPAVAVVATHFHNDRAGGAAAARAAGVPVHASAATRRLLGDANQVSHPFARDATIDLGDARVELFYPGADHSPDNIVVYLPEQRLLFGGCLIRAAESSWIGNLSDADVASWPATVDRVIARYGDARIVVPGHGTLGDASLLAHTRRLAVDAARP